MFQTRLLSRKKLNNTTVALSFYLFLVTNFFLGTLLTFYIFFATLKSVKFGGKEFMYKKSIA